MKFPGLFFIVYNQKSKIMFPSLQDICSKKLCDSKGHTMKELCQNLNHMCFNKVLQLKVKEEFQLWKHRFAYVAVEIKKDEIEEIYAEPTMVCGDYFIDVWLKKYDDDEYTILTQHNDESYEYYFEYCKTHGLVNGDDQDELW